MPATAALDRACTAGSAARCSARQIPAAYADTTGTNVVTRPFALAARRRRWRDVGFLWFSATGGFVMSLLPVALLVAPVVAPGRRGGRRRRVVVAAGARSTARCWSSGGARRPPWSAAGPLAERNILGHSRVEQLERRVEEVAASRTETLDHSAAEVRRIERDLHDGAQARIAAVGMNVGLAEKLIATDPEAAAELLREARETTVAALEDLRSVVRGIHPPALADRGLAGGIEALALPIPLPVTVAVDLPPALPEPVESAAYFAVAECLANTVKHAGATRAWVSGRYDDGVLHLVVGDDGRGGADPRAAGSPASPAGSPPSTARWRSPARPAGRPS